MALQTATKLTTPSPVRRSAGKVWLPSVLFLLAALPLGHLLPAWLWMWTLAVAVFAGFKWATFAQATAARTQPVPGPRAWTYLLLWPGMDAYSFLFVAPPRRTKPRSWLFAILKTASGAVLLWGIARLCGGGLLTGWIGMAGLIFLLHFGTFDLLAVFWQRRGFDAQPLMRAPLLSASLGEFWSRRWNSGFRDLVFGLWFPRLKNRFGPRAATFTLFLFSGLVHELVISFPARGGYGLPTAYFALQGCGLLAEHAHGSALARWRGRWQGRVWTGLLVAGPAFFLFHPPFVQGVILPFMRAIHAL